MPDNKKETQPQDASRINMNEDYEVQYWTKKFGCSKDELKDAVESVGVSAEKVEEFLGISSGKKR
jgi:hypothetical protein